MHHHPARAVALVRAARLRLRVDAARFDTRIAGL
jgi:hypothetical protein